jgi:thiol-disulfide isomerase/thioredoxin
MVMTPSEMVPLGSPAGDFSLRDVVGGEMVSRSDFEGQPLLVMFICNHCPFVRHIAPSLAAFATKYAEKGLGIVAIMSNDVANYPDDRPEKMKEEARDRGYGFPYLYDESQDVAKRWHAACTPDFFLYDADHRLVYRGQFDESRPGSDVPVTGRDLRAAADAVLAGEKPPEEQIPSMGCNIKWRAGNAPA